MSNCSLTKIIIRLSDKEGVIRGKANRPFKDVIRQIGRFTAMDANQVLLNYHAY